MSFLLGRNMFIWLIFPCHSSSLREIRIGTQLERNIYFIFSFEVTVSHWEKSDQLTEGRKLEAGTEAETMMKCYLVAFSPCLAQPALCNPGLPAQENVTYIGLGFLTCPISTIN